jgi:outer membrane lipoprotein-sorting protein
MQNAVLTALFTSVVICYADDDPKAILQKTSDTYGNAKSFHLTASIVSETKAGGSKMASSQTEQDMVLVRPDKVRVEFRYPSAGSWLRVSDGKMHTEYRALTKEVNQKPATPDDIGMLRNTILLHLEELTEGLKSAKLVGSEPFTLDGKSIDCHVIEAIYEPANLPPGAEALPTKYWIDKSRFIVLREVSGSTAKKSENLRTTTFSTARINELVADHLFAFDGKMKK